MKRVILSPHVLLKLDVLARHGWHLAPQQLEATVLAPERVDQGYAGRKVAQVGLDETHVLRVVYEETGQDLVIVTVYPGRRERYDKD